MENVSSTAEMYFLFSAGSSVIRCPHVQYIIPVLQCLRHALHCNFGSTLIISHSSVFPAAIIATFDSSLKGIEWSMLFEIILNCFFLWKTFDFLNQVMNATALRAFHRRIGNTGDVEINVLVIHRKVELIRVITIFEMTIFLHFVQSFLSIGLPRSIVIFQDAFFFLSIGLPRSVGRTEFFLELTNNLLGNGLPRSIFNGFWGIGLAWKNQIEVFLPSDC